jgi:putative transposase
MKQSLGDELVSNFKTLRTLKKKGKRVGIVNFKSKLKSINLVQYGVTWKFNQSKIHIQNLGDLRVTGIEQFHKKDLDFANAKLLDTPDGYYIHITAYETKKQKEENLTEIGIDLGCSTTATFSDGRKFNCSIQESERLKRLQAKLAGKKKYSKNWNKTRNLIGIEFQRLTNQKSDIANKIAAEAKKFGTIYIQD